MHTNRTGTPTTLSTVGLPPVGVRFVDRSRPTLVVREIRRLREDNDRLRRRCADLTASAELWVRLYEGALARMAGPAGTDAGHQDGPGELPVETRSLV